MAQLAIFHQDHFEGLRDVLSRPGVHVPDRIVIVAVVELLSRLSKDVFTLRSDQVVVVA